MKALKHFKQWCETRRNIVCKPEDRGEMLAMWFLREAQSLDVGPNIPMPLVSVENGMVWIRRG